MNFDFSEEQKLLRTTARDYLEDRAPLGLARSVLESDAAMSRELWAGAAEESIDPSRPSARFAFDATPAEPLAGVGARGDGDGWSLLRRILDRAAVLQAFEQLGTAQRAFDLTREQILDRHAFGRPIGSFQAIKHRMADLYATLEVARSNCWFAAWALANDDPGLPLAACTARVAATEAYSETSVEMVHLFGGAGFAWELDCHLFYRRARNLALALGPPAEWRDRLVDCLAAMRRNRT